MESKERSSSCDLCGSSKIRPVYQPTKSLRGLTVFLCQECGLVQSLPRIDHVASRQVRVSAGADWGNIRYGKGFRAQKALRLLATVCDLKTIGHCLDVGANRGSFALLLHEIAPWVRILAVEPDTKVVTNWINTSGIEPILERIEQVALPKEQFDLVHCSHTLEHLGSPHKTLIQLKEAMKPGAVLLIEVPNLNFIGRSDVVEEWFIDKHLYHFSTQTLHEYLRLTGFRVVDTLIDEEDITVIARRGESEIDSLCQADQKHNLISASFDLIRHYQATIKANRMALKQTVRFIHEQARSKRVVIWGAGRIFDSLVEYGQLRASLLAGVVDKYLVNFVDTVHGCPLLSPARLPELAPDLVIIASRSFFEEIKKELLTLYPGCSLLSLDDLLVPSPRNPAKQMGMLRRLAYGQR